MKDESWRRWRPAVLIVVAAVIVSVAVLIPRGYHSRDACQRAGGVAVRSWGNSVASSVVCIDKRYVIKP